MVLVDASDPIGAIAFCLLGVVVCLVLLGICKLFGIK